MAVVGEETGWWWRRVVVAIGEGRERPKLLLSLSVAAQRAHVAAPLRDAHKLPQRNIAHAAAAHGASAQ